MVAASDSDELIGCAETALVRRSPRMALAHAARDVGIGMTIFILDSESLFRRGLVSYLSEHLGAAVIGDAAPDEDGLAAAAELKPAVALLSLHGWAEWAGDVVGRLARSSGVLVILANGTHERAHQLLRRGALAIVAANGADTELSIALSAVMAGHVFISARLLAATIVNDDDSASPLSRRETEVLRLLARGFTGKEMAARLGIGVRTVETYKMRLKAKLGIQSRADLIEHAARCDLLD